MNVLPMPFLGLLGGLCIGGAAALLLLGDGRIAGVSGLAARAAGLEGDTPWHLAFAFTVGLPLGAAVFRLLAGPVAMSFPTSLGALVAAGLLVGSAPDLEAAAPADTASAASPACHQDRWWRPRPSWPRVPLP